MFSIPSPPLEPTVGRGRVAIGAAAKTKVGSVRITEAQSQYFQTHFGGIGKFLQAKVTEQLAEATAPRCNPTLNQHVNPHSGCILR